MDTAATTLTKHRFEINAVFAGLVVAFATYIYYRTRLMVALWIGLGFLAFMATHIMEAIKAGCEQSCGYVSSIVTIRILGYVLVLVGLGTLLG